MKSKFPSLPTDDDFDVYKSFVQGGLPASQHHQIMTMLWIIVRFLYFISLVSLQQHEDS